MSAPCLTESFLSESIERLKAVGAWLGKTARASTERSGPITPRSWGVTVRRGNTIYVHILDWQEPPLPKLSERIKSARMLGNGDKVEVVEADYGSLLKLPPSAHDPVDNIVVLKTE